MGASRPKWPMHTSESAATAVVHSLCVQDVDMLCAPRVLEFDMQWKRNAMPCRRGGEGSHRSAKGRSAKMRLRIASHLPPVRRVLYTSLVVPAPIVCFPPGEGNRARELLSVRSFLFAVRLLFRLLRAAGKW